MVTTASVLALCTSIIVAIGLPVMLLVCWHRKTNASYVDALVGALIYFVFAMVLEQLLHSAVLKTSIVKKPWAFVLYGSFAAGIFEETGRYVGFRFLLKKKRGKEDAIMYGIGHGGVESILLVGVSLVVSLLAVLLGNAGKTQNRMFLQAAQAIAQTPVSLLLASGFERAVALCLHISLSVLVFFSVKRQGRLWMFPLAIVFHAATNSLTFLYRYRILRVSAIGLEWLVALVTFLICLLVFNSSNSLLNFGSRLLSRSVSAT